MKRLLAIGVTALALLIPANANAASTTMTINAGPYWGNNWNVAWWGPFGRKIQWIGASNFRVYGVGEGDCWRQADGGWHCQRGKTHLWCGKAGGPSVRCDLVNNRDYGVATSVFLRVGF